MAVFGKDRRGPPITAQEKKMKLMEKPGSRVIDDIRVPEEECLYVLNLHAEFLKPEKIQESCSVKYGKSSFFNSVIRINNLIKDSSSRLIVNTYRSAYLNKVKEIPIAHKKIRLDDLNELRENFLKKIRENKLETTAEAMEFRQLAKGLGEVLMAARDEVEGKSMTFNQLNVIGDFNDKTDAELSQRRDELIRQAERALNGGAARAIDDSKGVIDTQAVESA